MSLLKQFKVFDSHFHIIDKRFPLKENQGYLPGNFTVEDYQNRTSDYNIKGGAIVSASFQAFDQTYLISALEDFGSGFVGVSQIPSDISDRELDKLNNAGVRAIRFNLYRGGSESVEHLEQLSNRVYEMFGWHCELYIDSKDLFDLSHILIKLPRLSIDHLGLSIEDFPTLLSLVEKGITIKASGFGRVNFDVRSVIEEIVSINPNALIFGTDLPSTRAPRAYKDNDMLMIIETLGEELAQKVLYDNAINFYKLNE